MVSLLFLADFAALYRSRWRIGETFKRIETSANVNSCDFFSIAERKFGSSSGLKGAAQPSARISFYQLTS